MFRMSIAMAAALTLAAAGAEAKITAQSQSGFSVAYEGTVPLSPAEAYVQFLDIGAWWSDDHTFSGKAENFTLEPVPGGCWCETLPHGGFVRHMDVIHAEPGSLIVLEGGLGPLHFMGVTGTMMATFTPEGAGTKITLTYSAGGFDPDGFAKWPAAVDGVIGAQFKRYLARTKG
ncbi:MAG: ATPase [Alphaproteobacteria bacterium]|nr:ATPase [Alphaproteobacteria bacterium]